MQILGEEGRHTVRKSATQHTPALHSSHTSFPHLLWWWGAINTPTHWSKCCAASASFYPSAAIMCQSTRSVLEAIFFKHPSATIHCLANASTSQNSPTTSGIYLYLLPAFIPDNPLPDFQHSSPTISKCASSATILSLQRDLSLSLSLCWVACMVHNTIMEHFQHSWARCMFQLTDLAV